MEERERKVARQVIICVSNIFEITSLSDNDVHRYVIIRKLLDSIFNMRSEQETNRHVASLPSGCLHNVVGIAEPE
jgi:hypothetical protein